MDCWGHSNVLVTQFSPLWVLEPCWCSTIPKFLLTAALGLICFSFGCSVKKHMAMRQHLRFKHSGSTFAASTFLSCSAINIFFSTYGDLLVPKWLTNDWTRDSWLHRSRFAWLMPISFSPRFSIASEERGGIFFMVIKEMLVAMQQWWWFVWYKIVVEARIV